MTAPQRGLFDGDEEPLPWETADAADVDLAGVVLNVPVDRVFDYRVPAELRGRLRPGQRVKVPFGRGNEFRTGFCVSVTAAPEAPEAVRRRWKPLAGLIDEAPLLDDHLLELTRWIAEEYLCPWGQVLESVVPAGVRNQVGLRPVTWISLGEIPEADEAALTAKQQALLGALREAGTPLVQDELLRRARCGTAPLNVLKRQGYVKAARGRAAPETLAAAAAAESAKPGEGAEEAETGPIQPSAEQQQAIDVLLRMLESGRHATALLHGVTGSGKTEVYIRVMREAVAYGRQVIVLVPEISLTPQTIRRFRRHFSSIAVLHSHLSDAERHAHWRRIARGDVPVVVGARSAVFAPCRNLGLIVIDEEHETTFKQETAPRYHARDVARKRAELAGIPLVLGSATPTLESWLRVQTGLDQLLTMPRRVAGRPLPPVQIVDVRHDPEWARGAAIGRVLNQQMRQALADGGQVILFLNMRGYSPVIWCRGCGSGIHCPNCDVILSYHQAHGAALCHACGFTREPPKVCPQCGRAGVLYLGTGTQRLEREVRTKFPGQVCLRMDSDSMRQRGSHGAALEAFRQGRAQILVGTQMIAKGLDFPEVTLVGVVDADGMLHQADLRAGERTFQLIAQVAGRTSRGPRGGRVIVQTGSPDERPIVLAARHDYETFAREELEQRQRLKAPPYTRLARVIVRGSSEALAEQGARTIAEALAPAIAERGLPVRMLGPAPAPVAKLQGKHRFHIQLCSPDRAALQELWREVQRRCAQLAQIEHVVDVDAISLR